MKEKQSELKEETNCYYEKLTLLNQFKRAWKQRFINIKLIIHGWFYWVLFKLGLGWKFNKWLCSIGKYRKFPDGRCMFCGLKH